MIGRGHHVVIDCPDPAALAGFYSALFGLPVTYRSEEWVVVSRDATTSGSASQRVEEHRPPRWPDPEHPQQMDLVVIPGTPRSTSAASSGSSTAPSPEGGGAPGRDAAGFSG